MDSCCTSCDQESGSHDAAVVLVAYHAEELLTVSAVCCKQNTQVTVANSMNFMVCNLELYLIMFFYDLQPHLNRACVALLPTYAFCLESLCICVYLPQRLCEMNLK